MQTREETTICTSHPPFCVSSSSSCYFTTEKSRKNHSSVSQTALCYSIAVVNEEKNRGATTLCDQQQCYLWPQMSNHETAFVAVKRKADDDSVTGGAESFSFPPSIQKPFLLL